MSQDLWESGASRNARGPPRRRRLVSTHARGGRKHFVSVRGAVSGFLVRAGSPLSDASGSENVAAPIYWFVLRADSCCGSKFRNFSGLAKVVQRIPEGVKGNKAPPALLHPSHRAPPRHLRDTEGLLVCRLVRGAGRPRSCDAKTKSLQQQRQHQQISASSSSKSFLGLKVIDTESQSFVFSILNRN